MCYIGVRTIVTEKTKAPDNAKVENVSVYYEKQSFEQ